VPYLLNFLYLLLIFAMLPWLLWQAARKGKYREGYAEKFFGLAPRRTSEKKCLWLHAVSVGEVNLLAPLLKRIQKERPDWECVVSTTTAAGMALAKKKYAGLTVFYCPLDFTWAASAAVRRIRPDALVLAELELWPNLIRAARRRGAKVAVINGRLGEKSFRGYRRVRWFIARLLRRVDLVAVQDESYAERFRLLGARPETVKTTGSMKYDGAETDRNNPKTRHLCSLAGIGDDDAVFLAGSTQEPEEAAVLEIFKRLADEFPRLRLIIVPRHPERFDEVARLLDQTGLPWQRRTKLEAENRSDGHLQNAGESTGKASGTRQDASGTREVAVPRILLVDVVGELGAWWGTATIAFVGGSFGNRGGQNMIEPAAYGAAVSFGPNTWNFRDIVAAMLEANAAVQAADAAELEKFVRRCLQRPDDAADMGRRAQSLVKRQIGATERTFALLAELVR
jgi:3-deoxy-D-manno-octulosonic-acid transferase